MAFGFRSSSSASSFSGGSLTIDTPAGVQEGDLLLAALVPPLTSSTPATAPSGWSTLQTERGVRLFAKTAGASEPSSYVFTVGTDGQTSSGVIAAFEDAEVAASSATGDAVGGTRVVAGVTMPDVGILAQFIALDSGGTYVGAGSATTPSGMTSFGSSNVGAAYESVSSGATGSRTWGGSGAFAGFSVGIIESNDAPNAPTITTMTGGVTVDLANVNRADWDFSDPDDGDSQSKFDLRYRVVGAGTWTDVTQTTPNTFYDFPAATFTADDYEWQVRTYDAGGLVGPYSASSFFTAASAPSVLSITDPLNGATIASEDDTITWSTPSQESYQVRKVADSAGSPDTGTVYYDSGEVVSTSTRTAALTFPTNSRTEHLQVRIKDGGLWSSWASISVNVSYTTPAQPGLSVYEDLTPGALSVQAVIPAPSGGEPTVSSIDIYRRLVDEGGDGIRVAAALAPSALFDDFFVASGVEYAYAVKSNGDNGTSAMSEWSEIATEGAVFYGGSYS